MIKNVHQQLISSIRCVLTDFLKADLFEIDLRGVEWVHGLFLFPIVLGKM